MQNTHSDQISGSDRSQELPDIALLLDVANAIEKGDDTELERLSAQSRNPERVYEHARKSSPFTSHALSGTKFVEHSTLWLIPVVTRGGAAHATAMIPNEDAGPPTAQLGCWLRDWFGTSTHVQCYDYLTAYSSISSFSPRQVRNTLDALTRRKTDIEVSVFTEPQELEAQQAAGLPDLAFLIGAASCRDEFPTIPVPGRSEDAALTQRLQSAIALWAGVEADWGRGERSCAHAIAMPAPFSQALCTGLQMWVAEVARDFESLAWDASPHGAGRVALEWDLVNRTTDIQVRIYRTLHATQLGEENIQTVLRCIGQTMRSSNIRRGRGVLS